jgi:hypothetical protein
MLVLLIAGACLPLFAVPYPGVIATRACERHCVGVIVAAQRDWSATGARDRNPLLVDK